jgi:hypothetical protein
MNNKVVKVVYLSRTVIFKAFVNNLVMCDNYRTRQTADITGGTR